MNSKPGSTKIISLGYFYGLHIDQAAPDLNHKRPTQELLSGGTFATKELWQLFDQPRGEPDWLFLSEQLAS